MSRNSHGLWLALLMASLTAPVLAGPTHSPVAGGQDVPQTGPRRQDGGGFGGDRRRGPRSSKFQISHWLGGVKQLESGKSALNKVQAKKVVAITGPWRTKKTMTDDEAKVVYGRLTAVLTAAQQKQVSDFRGRGFMRREGGGADRPGFGGPGGDRPDGPPPGGFGGGDRGPRPDGQGFGGRDRDGRGPDGGGRPMGGDRPNFESMRGYMTTVNPLASPKLNPNFSKLPDFMQEMLITRFRESDALLTKLAKKAK